MESVLSILEDSARVMRAGGTYVSSVRVSACYGTSRAIMAIKWSIAQAPERRETGAAGVAGFVIGRPADRLLRLPGMSDRALNLQIADAAWRLGAWDLMRYEKPPLPAEADIRDPRYGLAIMFGRLTYWLSDIGPMAEGDGASDEELDRAAREGWVDWLFKPLALANDAMRLDFGTKDTTLDQDCRRGPKTLPDYPFREAGRCLELRLGKSPCP